jgi:hypothetical protein
MDSFKAVLIKDARIADITSQEVYGVISGGSQSTQQQIAATSASSSSLVFQVQVPSENIVIDSVTITGNEEISINKTDKILSDFVIYPNPVVDVHLHKLSPGFVICTFVPPVITLAESLKDIFE